MFAKPGLLAHAGNAVAIEGPAEGAEGLEGAAVGGDVEVHLPVGGGGRVGVEQGADAAAAVLGLQPAAVGERDVGVGDLGVDALVDVALALPVADEDDAAGAGAGAAAAADGVLREGGEVGGGTPPAAEGVLAAAVAGGGWRAQENLELHGAHIRPYRNKAIYRALK